MNRHYPSTAVIIPAAGIGARMRSEIPKQFLSLGGVPVIVRTCRPFLMLDTIESIVIVCHKKYRDETEQLIRRHHSRDDLKRFIFTVGGRQRQDSVAAGLAVLPKEIEVVLVHDAARPLIDQKTIQRVMDKTLQSQAAIAAVPARDTLKLVADKRITDTMDRSSIWMAQTPQAAGRGLFEQAFLHAEETGFQGTDEASVLEHYGTRVHIVPGSRRNLKITCPEDLQTAEMLITGSGSMNIGHGYDAHRLVAGRKLILGGVEIPSQLGLEGHSDADVVCHALADAILGALGAGDIGRHFPDNDEHYHGISSLLLLEQVIKLMHKQDMIVGNTDLTILCQQPRLASYLPQMRANLAGCCNIEENQVNIKATTTEKMGFVGRQEGISAHAVVLLQKQGY